MQNSLSLYGETLEIESNPIGCAQAHAFDEDKVGQIVDRSTSNTTMAITATTITPKTIRQANKEHTNTHTQAKERNWNEIELLCDALESIGSWEGKGNRG